MEMRWKNTSGQEIAGQVPAHLRPYVEVLGMEGAIAFFLRFGGARTYLSRNPQAHGSASRLFGAEPMAALARQLGAGHVDVPIPSAFIARVLRSQGIGTSEIARRLHRTQVTIRGYFNDRSDDDERPVLRKLAVKGVSKPAKRRPQPIASMAPRSAPSRARALPDGFSE